MGTQAQDEAFETERIEQEETADIRAKILHLLRIYPIISPTMLQGGLGPAMRPAKWRPIYQELIAEGLIVVTPRSLQTHQERFNTYTCVQLKGTKVVLADD